MAEIKITQQIINEMQAEFKARFHGKYTLLEFEVYKDKDTEFNESPSVFGKVEVIKEIVYPALDFKHTSWINFEKKEIDFQMRLSQFDCFRKWQLKQIEKNTKS